MRRPIYQWLEAALYLFLIYLLLASGITYATWQYSIWQSEDAIRGNPGFTERLELYSEAGQDWGAITQWFTLVEPFSRVTGSAKSLGVWGELIRWISRVHPTAGTALDSLDISVESLLRIREQVSSLARLDGAASTVEQYMYRPTRNAQKSLHDTFVGNTNDISEFFITVDAATSVIDSLDRSFNLIGSGLYDMQENSFGPLSLVAKQLTDIFAPAQSHTHEYTVTFSSFRAGLHADLITMDTIIKNTERAQQVEQMAGLWIMQPLIARVSEHLLLVTLTILVGLLLRRNVDRRW